MAVNGMTAWDWCALALMAVVYPALAILIGIVIWLLVPGEIMVGGLPVSTWWITGAGAVVITALCWGIKLEVRKGE